MTQARLAELAPGDEGSDAACRVLLHLHKYGRCSRPLLSMLADMPRAQLNAALAGLEARGRICSNGSGPDATWQLAQRVLARATQRAA